MIIYRIYIVPNADLSGSSIGVIYDPDNLFKVVAYRKGPDFEYDSEKNITTLKLDDDLIEIFPDHETINQIKKSKQIKLLDRYTDPVSRIVDKIFTINFDKNEKMSATTDTCHPNDYGFISMAKTIYPVLKMLVW